MLHDIQEVLEYSFDIFNKVYFNNSLPKAVITIMSSKGAYGHFTLGKVWRMDSEHLHEINISAEEIRRPMENICATLIHEMVHMYCFTNGVKDTSQHGRYHNKRFKQEAELRGLRIDYAQSIGYSVTTPTEELVSLMAEYGIVKPLDINRDGVHPVITAGGCDNTDIPIVTVGIDTPAKKKGSTRKYICSGGCGCSFRATKTIRVLCLDCMAEYVLEKK